MPEVQEVYRMATQKVRPDPGAMERQRQKQRWQTGKQKAVVYALAAGLMIGAVLVSISLFRDTGERPATPPPEQDAPVVGGQPPTVESLAGSWWEPVRRSLLVHGRDGTYAFFDDVILTSEIPFTAGTYEVDGRTIRYVHERGRAPVEGWEVEAGISEEGRLHVIYTVSNNIVGAGTEAVYVRISPPSQAGDEIGGEAPSGEGEPLERGSQVYGVWLLEGTGHLLRLSSSSLDGTYALDGEGTLGGDPQDRGSLEIGPQEGTMTLTSDPGSRTCAAGDQSTWTNVRVHPGGFVSAEVERADCPLHADLGGTWIRLVP